MHIKFVLDDEQSSAEMIHIFSLWSQKTQKQKKTFEFGQLLSAERACVASDISITSANTLPKICDELCWSTFSLINAYQSAIPVVRLLSWLYYWNFALNFTVSSVRVCESPGSCCRNSFIEFIAQNVPILLYELPLHPSILSAVYGSPRRKRKSQLKQKVKETIFFPNFSIRKHFATMSSDEIDNNERGLIVNNWINSDSLSVSLGRSRSAVTHCIDHCLAFAQENSRDGVVVAVCRCRLKRSHADNVSNQRIRASLHRAV